MLAHFVKKPTLLHDHLKCNYQKSLNWEGSIQLLEKAGGDTQVLCYEYQYQQHYMCFHSPQKIPVNVKYISYTVEHVVPNT